MRQKFTSIRLPAELVVEFRRRRKAAELTPAGFMRHLLALDDERRPVAPVAAERKEAQNVDVPSGH